MAKAKYDTETVRSAAAGRWKEILPIVSGVDGATLDGNHHPCPKCGGTDRFRMIDAEAGALLCGQCFNKANGDGFAALSWLLSIDFPTALAKVAEHLGIRAAGSASPEKDLEWRPWNGNLIPYFASRRPGITEDALLAAGAKLARYKNSTVYALPIIGEDLNTERPVGWVLLEAKGGTLPKFDKTGAHIGETKAKITYGSKPGFVGQWGLERMAMAGMAEVIWKVEGVTDLLAMQSAIPEALRERHLVVTNANGAGQHPKWMASAIARAKTYILHDADQPGEAGAKQWALEVARHDHECGIVRLPYEIAETHGKDLRDWFNEGNTYDDLLRLAELAEVYRPKGADAPGEVTAEYPMEQLILSRLGLEVLYETSSAAVRVFSAELGKSTTFDNLAKLSKTALIQAAGPRTKSVVSTDPDGMTTFTLDAIKEAIALMASLRRGKQDERGVGVWPGVRDDGSHNDAIILSNDNEGARWNGDRVLKRITTPRVDGMVLDFGDGDRRWYDFETLESYCRQAEDSVEWRTAVVEETVTLFDRWLWRGRHDAELVTGLVMASWIQTLWAWRPQIVITGESNSGKSTLYQTLAGKLGTLGIFGRLGLSVAKTSEAGFRQGIGNNAFIVMLDEFEISKDRNAILQTIRGSSRGDTVMKGTAGHTAKSFTLQHMVWLAAIESGMSRQPDINRFVHLELKKAPKADQGKLVAPDPADSVRLGQKLLACAIVCGIQARNMAIELKRTRIEKADSRLIETYAVPAAMLGAACGFDREQMEETLRQIMGAVLEHDDEPVEADHDLLLAWMMDAKIRCDHGKEMVVSRLLDSYLKAGVEYASHGASLQGHGLDFRQHPTTSQECLIVHCKMASQNLLAATEWKGSRIDQLLLRIDGAERRTMRLNNRPVRCVVIPIPTKYLDQQDAY